MAISLGADQFVIDGITPKVDTARAEERASEAAEREDETCRLAALESGAGKLEEKLLKGLFRMRRREGSGISSDGRQAAPSALANRLKTIGLHLEPTLESQIESSELRGAVPN